MKDERINERLNIIKRNNLIIIAVVATVYIIFKTLINLDFVNIISEIYFLATSLIVLFIAVIYDSSEKVSDERVYKNILKIYDIGFWFVVISGIMFYFVSLLFLEYDIVVASSLNSNITPNSSINSMIFWCMLLSLINVRRNNMTFNAQIIEKDKRDYYKTILQRILYIFIYYLIVYGVVTVFRTFIDTEFTELTFLLSILISFLSMSILYTFFSIYEKYHYDEIIIKEDQNKISYVSKKVWLIMFVVAMYSLLSAFLSGFNSYMHFIGGLQSSIFLYIIYIMEFILKAQYLDFFILNIILFVILFRTIKELDLGINKYLPIFITIISITLLYNLIYNYLSILLSIGFGFGNDFVEVIETFSFISMCFFILILIVNIFVSIIIYNRNLKKEAILYFIGAVILPVIATLSRMQFNNVNDILLYGFIVNISLSIVGTVIVLIAIRCLSNKYKIIEALD